MTDRHTPNASAWISPAEAASILGVDPRTLARLADDGKIRAIRPGSHRRYNRADVEARVG